MSKLSTVGGVRQEERATDDRPQKSSGSSGIVGGSCTWHMITLQDIINTNNMTHGLVSSMVKSMKLYENGV